MNKKFLLLISSVLAIALFSGCASGTKSSSVAPPPSEAMPSSMAPVPSSIPDLSTAASMVAEMTMTADELAKYNGKDGQPAYVAIEGIVYDVTDVSAWKGGEHQGIVAGQDITSDIETLSPHGLKVLTDLPVVGTLV